MGTPWCGSPAARGSLHLCSPCGMPPSSLRFQAGETQVLLLLLLRCLLCIFTSLLPSFMHTPRTVQGPRPDLGVGLVDWGLCGVRGCLLLGTALLLAAEQELLPPRLHVGRRLSPGGQLGCLLYLHYLLVRCSLLSTSENQQLPHACTCTFRSRCRRHPAGWHVLLSR